MITTRDTYLQQFVKDSREYLISYCSSGKKFD